MASDPPQSRMIRPHGRLVPHEIRLAREPDEAGGSRVLATVHCERRQCTMDVDDCARCERFVRIDVHEAGYLMMCRDRDETLPPQEHEIP